MAYSSKHYNGFEIRFYEDRENTVGCLYKDDKLVGLKDEEGEIMSVEYGTMTSILKRLKGAIDKYSKGQATLVDASASRFEAKFEIGDIIIERETNCVTPEEAMVILDVGTEFAKSYRVLQVKGEFHTDVKFLEAYMDKDTINGSYITIGNDNTIIDLYKSITKYELEIAHTKSKIYNNIDSAIKILSKTNDDFYKDLLAKINESDATSYEKEKYIEFLSAAYNNSKE